MMISYLLLMTFTQHDQSTTILIEEWTLLPLPAVDWKIYLIFSYSMSESSSTYTRSVYFVYIVPNLYINIDILQTYIHTEINEYIYIYIYNFVK